VAAAGALAATAAARGPVTAVVPPSIRLAEAFPSLIRIGDTLRVSGRVDHGPHGTAAALEVKRTAAWSVVSRARLGRGGAFTLRWAVTKATQTGPVSIRVAAVKGRTLLAATRAEQVGIGPAAVACAPPVPPAVMIPAGDGWIEGGLIDEGGAFPGIDSCSTAPYTVSASNASGAVVATQQVAASHSYTLVVPAGTYTLQAGMPGCRGSATVVAGQQTLANTYCLFP
jgi:hypothetical protein